MTGRFRSLLLIALLAGFAFDALAFRCQFCGKDGIGEIFIVTDHVTGEQKYACSNCTSTLPRCDICEMPVPVGTGMTLPDGRVLCSRDAKDAVLDVNEAKRIFVEVQNEMNHRYVRFTEFPLDVTVDVIDRVDVDSMTGVASENPSILGLYHPEETDGKVQHTIRLLTGQQRERFRDVCAHELSHAWVKANVPAERHARMWGSAEEGFCEMMAYLLVEADGDAAEKKRILANNYTRGQVLLFVEAEQHYGLQDVLDWMQYGETSRLEEGHLDRIRDVKMPSTSQTITKPPASPVAAVPVLPPAPPRPAPTTLELEGIIPGAHPMAIINHHPFAVGDESKVKIGVTNQTIRCLAIQKDSVHVKNTGTGVEQDLFLSK